MTKKLPQLLLVLLVVTDLQSIAAITPYLARSLQTSATMISYSLVAYAIAAALVAALLRSFRHYAAHPAALPLAACVYALACYLPVFLPEVVVFLSARPETG